MYLDELKTYLIHLVGSKNIEIDGITIKLSEMEEKDFYNINYGVTWGEEICLNCYQFMEKSGISCDTDGVTQEGLEKLKKLYLRIHPDKRPNEKLIQDLMKMTNGKVVQKKDMFAYVRNCQNRLNEGCMKMRHSPIANPYKR